MATANKGPLVDLKPDISSYSHGQDGMSSTESEGVAGPSSGRRKKPSMTKRTSSSHHHHDHHDDTGAESDDGHHHGDEPRKKRSKRSTGKACVYCRRSHMVCEGGRPCERCIKREIPHLCRDFTPPPHHPHHSDHKHERTRTTSPHLEELPAIQEPLPPQPQPVLSSNQPPQLPPQQLPPIYSDPNFPPTWPLLPDSNGQITFSSAPMEQQLSNPGTSTVPAPSWHNDDSELAALNKFMKDLGVPNLPTDFLAFMNQLEGQDPNGLAVTSLVDDLTTGSITPTDSNGVFPTPPQGPSSATKQFVAPPPSLKGKGRDASGSKLSHMSRM
ncbi:hypothetical protein CI109_100489 [Kwoniella shandongensis]|uniref:Zn(2)-C6 fungal-type domain-containing protein n=1 Tax=Kwoniella shandongensis TaxID=1734106 RepID=A0AAJ8LF88_9TREE